MKVKVKQDASGTSGCRCSILLSNSGPVIGRGVIQYDILYTMCMSYCNFDACAKFAQSLILQYSMIWFVTSHFVLSWH